ncbi:unnamed protein product [Calicophoron daubneyi]|uniref:Uncharacterized protein n=1 Tax=Calicophoron daubneyi TaxID=300641 RepID=A0AAV2TAU6_CALDB
MNIITPDWTAHLTFSSVACRQACIADTRMRCADLDVFLELDLARCDSEDPIAGIVRAMCSTLCSLIDSVRGLCTTPIDRPHEAASTSLIQAACHLISPDLGRVNTFWLVVSITLVRCALRISDPRILSCYSSNDPWHALWRYFSSLSEVNNTASLEYLTPLMHELIIQDLDDPQMMTNGSDHRIYLTSLVYITLKHSSLNTEFLRLIVDLFRTHFDHFNSRLFSSPSITEQLISAFWWAFVTIDDQVQISSLAFLVVSLLRKLPSDKLSALLSNLLPPLTDQLLTKGFNAPLSCFSALVSTFIRTFDPSSVPDRTVFECLLQFTMIPFFLYPITHASNSAISDCSVSFTSTVDRVYRGQSFIRLWFQLLDLTMFIGLTATTFDLVCVCLDCFLQCDRYSLATLINQTPELLRSLMRFLLKPVHLDARCSPPTSVCSSALLPPLFWELTMDRTLEVTAALLGLQCKNITKSSCLSRGTELRSSVSHASSNQDRFSVGNSPDAQFAWSMLSSLLLLLDAKSTSPGPVRVVHCIATKLIGQLRTREFSLPGHTIHQSIPVWAVFHIRDLVRQYQFTTVPGETPTSDISRISELCGDIRPPLLVFLETQYKPFSECDDYLSQTLVRVFTEELFPLLNDIAPGIVFTEVLPKLSVFEYSQDSVIELEGDDEFSASSTTSLKQTSTPLVVLFLTKLLIRLIPRSTQNSESLSRGFHISLDDTRISSMWIQCADHMASLYREVMKNHRIVRASEAPWKSRRVGNYTAQLEDVLSQILSCITSLPGHAGIRNALFRLLRLFLFGCTSKPSHVDDTRQLSQLNPRQLRLILSAILEDLKNPSIRNCGTEQCSLASDLLDVLLCWSRSVEVLSPSAYSTWPQSGASGFMPYACNTCSLFPDRDWVDTNRNQTATRTGLMAIEQWLTKNATKETKAFHVCSFAMTHLAYSSDEFWFAPAVKEVKVLSTPDGSATSDRNPSTNTSKEGKESYDASYTSLTVSSWLQVPVISAPLQQATHSDSLTEEDILNLIANDDLLHVLSFSGITDQTGTSPKYDRADISSPWSVQVSLVIDGQFVTTTDLPLADAAVPESSKISPSHGQRTLVYFGHRPQSVQLRQSHLPGVHNSFDLGSVFVFIDHRTPLPSSTEDSKRLALSLALLGPDWSGCFDSLEPRSTYQSIGSCVLRRLFRRMSRSPGQTEAATNLMIDASKLLLSTQWLDQVKRYVHDYLFAFIPGHSPDRIVCRSSHMPSLSDPTSPIVEAQPELSSSHINPVTTDVLTSSPLWMFDRKHSLQFFSLSVLFSPQKTGNPPSEDVSLRLLPAFILSHHKVDLDLAFEPHGSLDVAIYLLGKTVCREKNHGCRDSELRTQLQCQTLQLLFTLLNNSTTMASQFFAPALPHPGIEQDVDQRRHHSVSGVVMMKNPLPLSVGHCFLARLFRHPLFASTSACIVQVLVQQLFALVSAGLACNQFGGLGEPHSPVFLLMDPSLLRTLISFGPVGFWFPSVGCLHTSIPGCSRGEQQFWDAFVQKGLLPHTYDVLSTVFATYPTANASTPAALTALFLDRWDILVVAYSSFREHFPERQSLMPSSPSVSDSQLDAIVKQWPLNSLLKLTFCRLLWPVSLIGAQNPLTKTQQLKGDREIRSTFNRICRLVISSDADMYLLAAEQVFATTDGLVPFRRANSGLADTDWEWWHFLTSQCVQDEHWLLWRKPPEKIFHSDHPPCKGIGLNLPIIPTVMERTESSDTVQSNDKLVAVDSDKKIGHPPSIVDWSSLPRNEATAAEINAMAKFSANLTSSEDRSLSVATQRPLNLSLPSFSEEEEDLAGGLEGSKQSHNEVQVNKSGLDSIQDSVVEASVSLEDESDTGSGALPIITQTSPMSPIDEMHENQQADGNTSSEGVRFDEVSVTGKVDSPTFSSRESLDSVNPDNILAINRVKDVIEHTTLAVELRQQFGAAIVLCLEKVWSACQSHDKQNQSMCGVHSMTFFPPDEADFINFPSEEDESKFNLHPSSASFYTDTPSAVHSVRPPLWLVHSLTGHPWVRMREAALSAYFVWLQHMTVTNQVDSFLQTTEQSSQNANPSPGSRYGLQSSHPIMVQLLRRSSALHLSDPESQVRSGYKHRHMCSPRLMNLAFDLVLSGLTQLDDAAPCTKTPPNNFPTSKHPRHSSPQPRIFSLVSSTPCTSSESEPDAPTQISYVQNHPQPESGPLNVASDQNRLESGFSILMAVLIASTVDAIMSCIPAKDVSSSLVSGTPEVRLCSRGLSTLIILLQIQENCLFPAALRSGLLPTLYNIAWLLELAVARYEALKHGKSQKKEDNYISNNTPTSAFSRLLTQLNRLVARVANWSMNESLFRQTDGEGDSDVRFTLITGFLRHLLSMSPYHPPLSDIQLRIADQGSVSRCLVRRVLYSLLDTLTRQFDQAANKLCQMTEQTSGLTVPDNESEYVNKIVRLFKQLTWVVEFTVEILALTPLPDDEEAEFLRSFDPVTGKFKEFQCNHRFLRTSDEDVSTTDAIGAPHSRRKFDRARPASRSRDTRSHSSAHLTRSHSSSAGSDTRPETCALTTTNAIRSDVSSYAYFQLSLDQALLTSIFTTAAHIQSASVFKLPERKYTPVTSSDCLTLFCKALGRLLIRKTQKPPADVAIDPLIAYFLRLCSEDLVVLDACLASLPQKLSLVLWTHLVDLENWLVSFMASEFVVRATVTPSSYGCCSSNSVLRSCSLPCLPECHTTFLIFGRLEQLFYTIHSLLSARVDTLPSGVHSDTGAGNSTGTLSSSTSSLNFLSATLPQPFIRKHNSAISLPMKYLARRRELLSTGSKKQGLCLDSLSMEDLIDLHSSVRKNNTQKSRLPLLLNLLLPSSSGFYGHSPHSSPISRTAKSVGDSRTSVKNKKYTTKHLFGQAHHQCIDGHSVWREALGERLRITGPLGTVLWARLADRLGNTGSPFHCSSSAPGFRYVDPVEGPMRQRRRNFLSHLPLADRLVHEDRRAWLAHRRDPHPLASLVGLPAHVDPPSGRAACIWYELPLYLPLPSTPLVQLASASRNRSIGAWACRLVGLVHVPPLEGDLVLGQTWLRFQHDLSDESVIGSLTTSATYVNPADRLWLAWSLSSIDRVEERRFALRDVAVEIFTNGTGINAPTLLAMHSTKDRDRFVQALQTQLDVLNNSKSFSLGSAISPGSPESQKEGNSTGNRPPARFPHRLSEQRRQQLRRLQAAQRLWLDGQLSNFAYLMELNSGAGRTYNDLMQYPIFPWTIRDYESAVLDLGHPGTYRRLDRPIAVQSDERASAVAAHYAQAEQHAKSLLRELADPKDGTASITESKGMPARLAGVICPPYHYPSHCSNEAIVLNFLVRLLPHAIRHLRFQDNNFDVPDRLFHSVATTWRLSTTSITCVKELVPEFYFCPELFVNSAGLALGCRQPGNLVDDVEMPPWAKNSPRLFTLVCRAALESDYVTTLLPAWIDLTFGYQQTGKNAKEALNLYHPYTYFGAIDVDQIEDPIRAQAVEAMISNYGQTPKQLFRRRPHPSRFSPARMNMSALVAPPSMSQSVSSPALPIMPGNANRAFGANEFLNLTDHSKGPKEVLASTVHSQYQASDVNAADEYQRHNVLPPHCEVTPLETVIGLRWGSWAGSPHASPLQVITQFRPFSSNPDHHHDPLEASSDLGVISYLTGAVWYDHDLDRSASADHKKNNVISARPSFRLGLITRLLREAWDGCVVSKSPPIVPSYTSVQIPRNRSPNLAIRTLSADSYLANCRWTLMGCERGARVWLSHGGEDETPELIKISCCALNPGVLKVIGRKLSSRYAETEDPRLLASLTLPVKCCIANPSSAPLITALAVSPRSSSELQLFVGTRVGSLYARRLPANFADVSSSGWIPEGYTDSTAGVPPLHIPSAVDDAPNSNDNPASDNAEKSSHAPVLNDAEVREAGLWEVTGWRQLVGHADHAITSLAVSQQYGLLASGDSRGHVCMWDAHRLTIVHHFDTNQLVESDEGSSTSPGSEIDGPTEVHTKSSAKTTPYSSRRVNSGRTRSRSKAARALPVYGSIDGLCFSPVSGELAVARWNRLSFHACWLGVYSPSGTPVMTRILDFYAEISDASVVQPRPNDRSHATVPMAFSTVPEGRGVNCLLLGGPGGRLIWLNSWTLDTVHTMILPQSGAAASSITALCFTPSSLARFDRLSQQIGEVMCQGLCAADDAGWVYFLAPHSDTHFARSKSIKAGGTEDQTKARTFASREHHDIFTGLWLENERPEDDSGFDVNTST